MRNLELITTPVHGLLAQNARRAFMEQTATWSVSLREITTTSTLDTYLSSHESDYPLHAIAFDPHFSGTAYHFSSQANATGELSQGCDCLSYLEPSPQGTFLMPLSLVDCFEKQFFPLEGAQVAILGAGHLGLACAYECARCGVSEILLADNEREIAERNLEAFLAEFARLRGQVIDMRQAQPGHVSFQQAYEKTDYYFGAYQSTKRRIAHADVIICATDRALPASFISTLDFSHRPFIVDCMHTSLNSALVPLARIEKCAILNAEDIWQHWGVLLAQFLTHSNTLI